MTTQINQVIDPGDYTVDERRQLGALHQLFQQAKVAKRLRDQSIQIDDLPKGTGNISVHDLMLVRNAVLQKDASGNWMLEMQVTDKLHGTTTITHNLRARPLYPWFQPAVNEADPRFSVGLTVVLAFPLSRREARQNDYTVFLPLYPDQMAEHGLGSCERPDSIKFRFGQIDGRWLSIYNGMDVEWAGTGDPIGQVHEDGSVTAECEFTSFWNFILARPKPVLDATADQQLREAQQVARDEFLADNGVRVSMWDVLGVSRQTDRAEVLRLLERLDVPMRQIDPETDVILKGLVAVGAINLRHHRKAAMGERRRFLKAAQVLQRLTYHRAYQVPLEVGDWFAGLDALKLLDPSLKRDTVRRHEVTTAAEVLRVLKPKQVTVDDPVLAQLTRVHYPGELVVVGKTGAPLRKLRARLIDEAEKLALAFALGEHEFRLKSLGLKVNAFDTLGLEPGDELRDDFQSELVELIPTLRKLKRDAGHPTVKALKAAGYRGNLKRRDAAKNVQLAITLALIQILGESTYQALFPKTEGDEPTE